MQFFEHSTLHSSPHSHRLGVMDHWCGVGVFYHGEDTISTNLAFVTKRVLAAFLWEHYLKQCNYWILIFGPVNFKFF